MKKRICPICEQEMKSRNYCRVCRKFVKNPIIQEVNYRLNEGESFVNYCDCDYHTPSRSPRPSQGSVHKESVRENKRSYERGVQSGASISRTGGARRAAYQGPQAPVRGGIGKKRQAAHAVALFFLFLFLYVGSLLLNIGMRRAASGGFDASATRESEASVEVYEDEIYYTDEEVQAQGLPCNGYAHFSIQSDVLYEQLIGWARQNIASLVSTREDSENVAYPDSDVSYYDTYVTYYFPSASAEHADNYIEIGYDTVNTQVHYVNICLSDEGKWLTLTEKTMELLAAGEDNLAALDTGLDKFRLDYVTGKLESDGIWESELFDVYFYRYSDGIPYISICRMEG